MSNRKPFALWISISELSWTKWPPLNFTPLVSTWKAWYKDAAAAGVAAAASAAYSAFTTAFAVVASEAAAEAAAPTAAASVLVSFDFVIFFFQFCLFFVYRRSRLLFSSLRAHISEIIGAVAAHISSQASPVFGTSAKKKTEKVENFQRFPKTSERLRMLPSASERVRTHPGRSEQVQTRLRSCENFEKLDNCIAHNYKLSFPEKKARFNKYKHKISPWITNGILKSIHRRDNLAKKIKNTPYNNSKYEELCTNLKVLRQSLRSLIREAKKMYYHAEFQKLSGDCKRTWNKISEVLNKNHNKKQGLFF